MRVLISPKGYFSISDECCERLIEIGVPTRMLGADYTDDSPDLCLYLDDSGKPTGAVYSDRSHPLLLQVFDEIGQRIRCNDINSMGGTVECVEIPDGTAYRVMEYECSCGEYIEEKHRTWPDLERTWIEPRCI